MTDDEVTNFAVTERYGAGTSLAELAERWRPYRMWAVVLLHVWVRNEVGLPRRNRPPAAARTTTRPRRTAPPGGSRSPKKPLS